MKKRVLATILAVIVPMLMLSACQPVTGGPSGQQNTNREVDVYNWGEYIDPAVLDAFEQETGIKVNYTTFATNEELYAKLKSGGAVYDVIIPSDYMIGRMIEEDMLEPIDFDNIPNFQKISERFVNPPYDPENKYSVPYMWGTVGLVYDTTKVEGEIDSWAPLFDPKYAGQILMFDNSRDAFGIALKYLGYSFNTTDENEINEAYELLLQQKPLVQSYVMDQIFDKLGGKEAAMGPYYAGDYYTMVEDNPDLAFVVPKEGSNLFVDAMCIPKGARNKKEAEEFINFMCSDEAAVANAETIYYSTPSDDAFMLLDEEISGDENLYPDDDILDRCEFFENLPKKTRDLYDQLWIKLKTN